MNDTTSALSPEAAELRDRLRDASPEDASSILRWTLAEAESNPQAARDLFSTLRELEADPATSKDLRKVVRKGLFLLRQKGLSEEEDASRTVLVETVMTWRAWLSTTDGSGTCRLLLARPDGKLNCRLLDVFIKESEGVVTADEDRFSQHDLAARVEDVKRSYGGVILFGEAPPEYVKRRLAQAIRRSREAGARVHSILAFWSGSLPEPTEDGEHPADGLDLPEDGSGAEIGTVLFQEPAFGWMYELAEIGPLVSELGQAADSKVEAEEHVKQQRYSGILREFTKRTFTERVAAHYVTRLKDMAYLQHLGGSPEAALAMRAAREVEAAGADSQFALALTQKTLVYLLELARKSR